jgi:hypothetical protein
MGKKNVPKAIGHVHDDNQSRKERAIAEAKEKARLNGVHHQMWAREDAGGLSAKELEQQEQKRKREEKERRAKAFLDTYVDPDTVGSGSRKAGDKCTYFNKPGGCKHGDRCRFLHDGVDGGAGRAGAGTCEASEQAPDTQPVDSTASVASVAAAESDEAAEQRLDDVLEQCAACGQLSEAQCDALTDAIADGRLNVRQCLREWDEQGTLDRLSTQLS